MNEELPKKQDDVIEVDLATNKDIGPTDVEQELADAEEELRKYTEAIESTVYPYESEDAEHLANSGRLSLENKVERLRKIAAGDDDVTKMQKHEYEEYRNS